MILVAAWMLYEVRFGGTKPCVFLNKVPSASDEKYLACAAVAVGVTLMFFWFRTVGVVAVLCAFLYVCLKKYCPV